MHISPYTGSKASPKENNSVLNDNANKLLIFSQCYCFYIFTKYIFLYIFCSNISVFTKYFGFGLKHIFKSDDNKHVKRAY